MTGFAAFIAATALLFALPLVQLIGTPVFWVLLPFLCAALAALYLLIMRNYRDGELVEELTLWPDRVALVRHNPRSPDQTWEANPHWVRLRVHTGPVPHYLTLSGGPREVELGAFLTPDERQALRNELEEILDRLR